MNETTDEEMLEVGGEAISLSQIANVDMGDVEEVRFVLWPVGIFEWRIKDAKLTTMTNKAAKRVPVIDFELECRQVKVLADEKINGDDWIEKSNHHAIWFGDKPQEDLGRAKAFMSDAGFKGSGTLQEMLAACAGSVFVCPTKHTVDKDDKDKKYCNLVTGKMEAVVVEEAAPPAETPQLETPATA